MTKEFHYLICKLSGNEVFILIMNSFAEISRGLWRHCAGHWGLEGLIEQSEHIVELIRSGRGLDAQVYITDKFNDSSRLRIVLERLDAPTNTVISGSPVRNIGGNYIVSRTGRLFYISAKSRLHSRRERIYPFRVLQSCQQLQSGYRNKCIGTM